ncbi:hypothetical protein [Pseudomonas sp. PDM25]|uniref:hypothetical protein n=1 Tax=Pseudomonas sp. PDM25 TaxID=2854772 RepID=UPI001C496459|nr:hypothetical protein [Pseudomonas sp. PDM25]MBV7510101.1 hypothetical protein [Pseudomonas sp. PDM25]
MAIASAREEDAKEQLIAQLAHSHEESASLRESGYQADTKAKNAQTLLETTQHEVDLLRQKLKQLQREKKPSRSEQADDQGQE